MVIMVTNNTCSFTCPNAVNLCLMFDLKLLDVQLMLGCQLLNLTVHPLFSLRQLRM